MKKRKEGEILQNVPVIVITVQDNSQNQVDALRLGATDYIVKPFVKEIVEYRVQNAIEMSNMMRKIAEEKRQLQLKSERDLLTGLYNKIATEERIISALREYPDKEHVLLIFDLDNFKQVNDSYGHEYGDKCIRRYADMIGSLFRSNDIVGRFGGDEFIAFMNTVSDKSVIQRKLEKLFQRLNEFTTREKMTTISVGYVMTDETRRDYKDLFDAADKALYQAKTNGKNQYVEYCD
ncbi:MAG: diguanylate cyclase [Lachnospiraceae bacterium]|nr:diguanylate cyclase [Lachnospiraceae bacterium]